VPLVSLERSPPAEFAIGQPRRRRGQRGRGRLGLGPVCPKAWASVGLERAGLGPKQKSENVFFSNSN
jgi:hypothetical protein